MANNSGHKALSGIALFLAIIFLAGVIAAGVWIGYESNWYRDWSKFITGGMGTEQPKDDEGGDKQENPPVEDELQPDVTDENSNALASGTAYEIPQRMLFSARTAESQTASEGVTVTATVKPDTAMNKSLTWSVKFADPTLTWAQGKEATDFVTVTVNEENSREATVRCLEPFGAQILVRATSVQDPTKSGTCAVDYLKIPTAIDLKFGEIECNIGGETGVTIELSDSVQPSGGATNLNVTYGSEYTVEDEYEILYSLDRDKADHFLQCYDSMINSQPHYDFCDGSIEGGGSIAGNDNKSYQTLNRYDVKSRGLYFGLKYFNENLSLRYLSYYNGTYSTNLLGESDKTNIAQIYLCAAGENKTHDGNKSENDGHTCSGLNLFDLTVTLKSERREFKFKTTFRMSGYTDDSITVSVSNSDGSNNITF